MVDVSGNLPRLKFLNCIHCRCISLLCDIWFKQLFFLTLYREETDVDVYVCVISELFDELFWQ